MLVEGVDYKVCTKCGIPTRMEFFHLSKRYSTSRQAQCSFCKREYRVKRYAEINETNTPERLAYLRAHVSEYRKLTPEQRELRKTERQNNIFSLVEIRKAQIQAEKDKVAEIRVIKDSERIAAAEIRKTQVAYNKQNRKAIAALNYKKLYHLDPVFKTQEILKKRAQKIFKREGWVNQRRSLALFGADYPTVKAHIESLFQQGMDWENHGEWHIDHKIPLSSAETIEEVYPLFHYKNLQPLWAKDNIRKSSKYYIL